MKFKIPLSLLFFIVIIVMAISRLEIRTDISDFFFSGDNQDAAFLINQLSADSMQRKTIISIAHPGVTSDRLATFMDELKASLARVEGVKRVWTNSLDESSTEHLIKAYSSQQIHLLSLEPQTQIPDLLEPAQLQQRAARIKSALLNPSSIQVKAILKVDPMLFSVDWLARVQSGFGGDRQADNYSVMFFETSAGGMDAEQQQNIGQQVEQIFARINAKIEGDFSFISTGVPVFARHIKAEVSRDIQRVSILSMLAIAALFIVVFRSPKALVLTAVLLLTTISGAVLVTQSVYGFVHGLTLALGVTLIGVCIDYFIHAMIHASDKKQGDSVISVRRIWPSLLLGGATTLLGYFALAASGFPGLQQIAVFSASGVVIALLMTRYILPDLMQAFALQLRPVIGSERLLTILRMGFIKMGLPLIALLCFLFGAMEIKWSDDLQSLSPDLEQLKANDSLIRSRMTSVEPGRFVLVEAADMQTALQRSEQLYLVLNALQKSNIVENYTPVFPWIASEKQQLENAQVWNEALESGLRENWIHALEKAGLSAEAFPALMRSENDYFDLDDLKSTAAWELLSRQIVQYDTRAMVVTWLGKHDVAQLKQALQAIPGARYFSQRESIDDLAAQYRQKAARMLVLGLLAILALLIWRFHSILHATKVLMPAILAIGFVLGIAGLTGTPLNMLHLVGLLLTAAICVDYGIFFTENRSGNYFTAFQAITASALTSAASFASLGVAQNPALQALAWTVAPGILIGFLLCPILLQPASVEA